MTVLDRVLLELAMAKGPIRSTELAGKVGVSAAALEGMLMVLVAKGKLAGTELGSSADVVACSGIACGTTCVGLDVCPFVADVPKTYSLVIQPVGGLSLKA